MDNKMVKKILFVINSLDSGGAEKSLVSLLNELEQYKHLYEVHLLLPNKSGLFYSQIPKYVNEIEINEPLFYMANSYGTILKTRGIKIGLLIKKIIWSCYHRINKKKNSGVLEQALWRYWSESLSSLEQEYDIAVGYLNGYPNYFVIDKVNAKRKMLWVHNEYQKLGYESEYDKWYYEKADAIATISDECVKDFLTVYPNLKNKVHMLQNITSGHLIWRLSEESCHDFERHEGQIIILSIGRLVEQKNFELAIDAAKYLKNNYPEFKFVWYIMGKGPLKEILAKKIVENGLEKQMILMGVRSNPYPYMRRADVFVQTSIYEGKSIVLDEAKILAKPIVTTNYLTVYDSVENRCTGLIVEKQAMAVGEAILEIIHDENIRNEFSQNLRRFKNGNCLEIEKYLGVMLGDELEDIKS